MGRRSAAMLYAMVALGAASVRAETREEWIALGARVHGGFGAFIPVGIRIGIDALTKLKANPRDVTVSYYDSDKAPCACIADGIMIATTASPGQRTLQIMTEKAPAGTIAAVVIRHKQTGESVRYAVSESWLSRLAEWNKAHDPAGRFDAVMKAEGLFQVESVK